MRPFKSFFLSAVIGFAVLVFLAPSASAVGETCDVNANCCTPPQIIQDGGGCPAGTFWIGSETGGSCQTSTVTCPVGDPSNFSCSTGRCAGGSTGAPTGCDSLTEISIGNTCYDWIKIFRENATTKVFKLWVDEVLGRVVYVTDADCTEGQVPAWNNTAKTWECRTSGGGGSLWTANGSDIYYAPAYPATGRVGIGVFSPQAKLDILGGSGDPALNEGDVRIGNNNYRLKIGVQTGGITAGNAFIRSVGGTSRLFLGGGTTYGLLIDGGINRSTFSTGTVDVRGNIEISGNQTVSGSSTVGQTLQVNGSVSGPPFAPLGTLKVSKVYIKSIAQSFAAQKASLQAYCNAGDLAVGGGCSDNEYSASDDVWHVLGTNPTLQNNKPNGWNCAATRPFNVFGYSSRSIRADAICVQSVP